MPGSGFHRAVADVQRELRQSGLGFLAERVIVSLSWSLYDNALMAVGLYFPGDRRRRCIGRIAIPAMVLPASRLVARLLPSFVSRPSTRFVLRHEYAHALAHLLGRFDAPGLPWGTGDSFTDYAATSADEDLAETVALFITHRGRMPRRQPSRTLRAKWRAAGHLIAQAAHLHPPTRRTP
jgi:hypothetical protein